MKKIQAAFTCIASEDPSTRTILLPLLRQAGKWEKMPKGWTTESRKKFWETLTGDNKHKVTKCIKEMGDKMDDPGAFCAALADRVMGPGWRKKKKGSQDRVARADLTPVRQRTQYSCMSASMAMCLRALGHDVTEDEVNKVMGARPMKGAAWEQALACAQHYGCRATLTMPSTVEQLKAWTDAGIPIMIAWNPEGRPWSHASAVYHVDDDLNVWVADPNIPDPNETTRVVPAKDFYSKWYEKFPDYLVRRPACAIEREITEKGVQIPPRTKMASKVRLPRSDWDKYPERERPFGWASPMAIDGETPLPWRVTYPDRALKLLKRMFPEWPDLYTDYESDQIRGHSAIWVGLRDNRQKTNYEGRMGQLQSAMSKAFRNVLIRGNTIHLVDDHAKNVLTRGKHAAYSGNPDGKPIYPVKVDHGENQALSGGSDIMKRLVDRYRIEQGNPPRKPNPRLARWNGNNITEVGSR